MCGYIKKGCKYIVVENPFGKFKDGTEVVALESCSVPYCVVSSAYDKDTCVFGYPFGLVEAIVDSCLKKVES